MDERFMEVACEQEEAERRFAQDKATKGGVVLSKDQLLAPGEYRAEECDDCGLGLEVFRKERGLTTCVYCQTRREKLGK